MERTCMRCGVTAEADDPSLLAAIGWQIQDEILCPICARRGYSAGVMRRAAAMRKQAATVIEEARASRKEPKR